MRFLDKHGGRDPAFYAAARELAARQRGDTRPPAALVGTALAAAAGDGSAPCDWAHPGATCDGAAVSFFPAALLRSIPVYAPVYLFPALLVHGRALFDGSPAAAALWAKTAKGVLRSSAFLALYCTLCWRGACVGFRALGRVSPVGIPATAWVGGLATLVEKKSRRMELALYCLSRAVESFALCVPEWWDGVGAVAAVAAGSPADLCPAPRRARQLALTPFLRPDVALRAAAAAAVGHCYSDCGGAHRDVFRSKYLLVLDFVLGGDGLDRGSIRHVPSASDRELLWRGKQGGRQRVPCVCVCVSCSVSLTNPHTNPQNTTPLVVTAATAPAAAALSGAPAAAATAVSAAAVGLATRARSLTRAASAAWGSVACLAGLAVAPSDADASHPPPQPMATPSPRVGEPPHRRPRFRNHGWEVRLSGDALASGDAESEGDRTPGVSPRGRRSGGSSGAQSPRPAWPPAARPAGYVGAGASGLAASPLSGDRGDVVTPLRTLAAGRPGLAGRARSFGGDEALAP